MLDSPKLTVWRHLRASCQLFRQRAALEEARVLLDEEQRYAKLIEKLEKEESRDEEVSPPSLNTQPASTPIR